MIASRYWVLLASLLAVATPGPVYAQLIRKTAPPAVKNANSSLEAFAARVGEFTGQPVDALAVEDGVPAPMAVLLRTGRDNPSKLQVAKDSTPEREARRWGEVLEELKRSAVPVNKALAAWESRRGKVEAALAASHAARSAGDLAAAQQALEAVLTPLDMDDEGNLEGRRHTDERPESAVAPEDAESAALLALADLARERGQFDTAIDACALLSHRRTLKSAAHERYDLLLSRFAELLQRTQARVDAMGELGDWSKNEAREAARKEQLGTRLFHTAIGCSERVLAEMPRAHLGGPQKAKKGEWVLIGFDRAFPPEQAVDEKALRFHGVRTAFWPKSCRATNRISGVDWNTGNVSYQQDCDWASKGTRLDLDATWAGPPPAWLTSEKGRLHNTWLVVAGKVDSAGPKWKLTQAFMLPPLFHSAVQRPEAK